MMQASDNMQKLLENVRLYVAQNYVEETVSTGSYEADIFGLADECLEIKYSNLSVVERVSNYVDNPDESWQEAVFAIIDEKGFTDPEVYKRASISKQTFSKIRGDSQYQPNKDTAIQMCFGLKLDEDESLDLMEKAGYSLSYSIKRDLVVRYFLENRIFKMDALNVALYELKLKLFPIN